MDQVKFSNLTVWSMRETEITLLCISTIILVIGVLGNCLTIGIIVFEKKFHTPTYVAIACLSFSDMAALTFSFLFKCVHPFTTDSFGVLPTVAIACYHVSTCHVILFAILRYLIVAHPFWSRRRVRVKVILFTSLCLWLYGATYGFIHLVVLEKSSYKSVPIIADRILEIVVPLVLILVFHCLKIRHLKQSKSSVISNQAKRMFKVTSVIACTYFVTMTPLWTVVILIFTNVFGEETPGYMTYVFAVSVLIFLLNFVADPFIYFVFTPTFRKHILKYFKCLKSKTYNTDYYSAYTSVSNLQLESQNSQAKNIKEYLIKESQV